MALVSVSGRRRAKGQIVTSAQTCAAWFHLFGSFNLCLVPSFSSSLPTTPSCLCACRPAPREQPARCSPTRSMCQHWAGDDDLYVVPHLPQPHCTHERIALTAGWKGPSAHGILPMFLFSFLLPNLSFDARLCLTVLFPQPLLQP